MFMNKPRGFETFLCSSQLSLKFSLLKNMKMPKSNKEFVILFNLKFIIKSNFMLS